MAWDVFNRSTALSMHPARRPWRRMLLRGLAPAVVAARLVASPVADSTPGTVPVTDKLAHLEPALAPLPAAGGILRDPVFQTPLMRLTDASDGSDCRVEYSYWPTFNVDGTRAKAVCVINGVNRTRIWTFDRVTVSRGPSTLMPQLLQSSDPIWSHSNPNVVYGHSQTHLLLSYDVVAQTVTTVKDFSALVPAGGQLQQMSMASNDDLFAFHITDAAYAPVGYLVWKRSTDAVILNQTEGGLDEVQLDKTGHFLTVGYRSGDNRIWSLQAAPMVATTLSWNLNGFFHHDSGRGTLLSYTGTTAGFGYRQLATPQTITTLILAATANKTAHMSMGADNEGWGLVSQYSDSGSAASAAFDNEIFQVATDGSGKVRRIAHHRSVFGEYYDGPFANISRDGRLVAFSSNWGHPGGRRDVFVANIEPAPLTVGPPPAPTNLRSLTSGQ